MAQDKLMAQEGQCADPPVMIHFLSGSTNRCWFLWQPSKKSRVINKLDQLCRLVDALATLFAWSPPSSSAFLQPQEPLQTYSRCLRLGPTQKCVWEKGSGAACKHCREVHRKCIGMSSIKTSAGAVLTLNSSHGSGGPWCTSSTKQIRRITLLAPLQRSGKRPRPRPRPRKSDGITSLHLIKRCLQSSTSLTRSLRHCASSPSWCFSRCVSPSHVSP